MTLAPDEDLMLQVRDGAGETLGVLFDRYQAPLFNFYSKLTGDRALSEDVVMKCEHIAELLPDYLQGSLSPEQHHNVEAHLEQCADCSEEVVIWGKLSLLPVDQPGPASRARFEAMLRAYQAGRSNQPVDDSHWRKRASAWNWNVFHWL